MRPDPSQARDRFLYWLEIPTRWNDNDMYGHVNNAMFYEWFDSLVNHYLIREGGHQPIEGAAIAVCAESQCRFYREVAFPQSVEGGLRVAHLGRSSVRYEIALFLAGIDEPVAAGYFVHVFVDRGTRRPIPIPSTIRQALEQLRLTDNG
jgi:acyl-CoA thioester hydrolase